MMETGFALKMHARSNIMFEVHVVYIYSRFRFLAVSQFFFFFFFFFFCFVFCCYFFCCCCCFSFFLFFFFFLLFLLFFFFFCIIQTPLKLQIFWANGEEKEF